MNLVVSQLRTKLNAVGSVYKGEKLEALLVLSKSLYTIVGKQLGTKGGVIISVLLVRTS